MPRIDHNADFEKAEQLYKETCPTISTGTSYRITSEALNLAHRIIRAEMEITFDDGAGTANVGLSTPCRWRNSNNPDEAWQPLHVWFSTIGYKSTMGALSKGLLRIAGVEYSNQ